MMIMRIYLRNLVANTTLLMILSSAPLQNGFSLESCKIEEKSITMIFLATELHDNHWSPHFLREITDIKTRIGM